MKSSLKPMESITQGFLKAVNSQKGPPIYKLPIDEARAVLSKAQAGKIEKPKVKIEDLQIPCGPSGQVSIRILRPETAHHNLPVIMYFHGGGWVLGGTDTHDRLIRELCVGAHAAVVFVEFSSSPESQYPVPVEEAYAATKYIYDHAASFHFNAKKIVVAGDSAGGNMAAAVTILAKKRKGPKIIFQLLFYPVTDANFETPSYKEFKTGYFLSREAMKWFWNQYAPIKKKRLEPTASPLRASLDQLKGLPPALVITGEYDVLRDEGEAYAHKLIQAGVEVTAIRYLGAIHDFVMLNALSKALVARSAIKEAILKLRSVFN